MARPGPGARRLVRDGRGLGTVVVQGCAHPLQPRGLPRFIHRLSKTSPGLVLFGTMIFYPLRLAGYGLLSIGVINLFGRGVFGLDLVKSI